MVNSPPADSAAATLQPGQVIDGFCLQERLHSGGMAHLWRVVEVNQQGDSRLPLLMKVPRVRGDEDPAAIVGFEVEQMIMPTLSGPCVPTFIAKGDFTRAPYIVMEQIEGDTLKPRLDAAPLPIDEVIEIGARVAAAVHALHRQNVIHLDIKPSNIMFRPDGQAVLIDFGLSRHDHLPDLLDEEFRLPLGTGPYMSPEQVQFVRNDPRSDLFALGVMLYHFTTGQRPFGDPHSVRGLRRRLYVDPVPPRALRADCPPWLQELILSCLEVRPERRCQSAAQLAFDLQNPAQIVLTRRAQRLQRSGLVKTFKRWFFALGHEPGPAAAPIAERLQRNPVVLAAVDVDAATPELLTQLRETVQRIVLTEPGARLACVSVMKLSRIANDDLSDGHGHSRHVRQLVALKHWARPIRLALGLDEARLTCHVLEATDVADAIIDFARRNQVEHIVLGARGQSALRQVLGSVSSKVAAQSRCSVTVAREADKPVALADTAEPAGSPARPPHPAPATRRLWDISPPVGPGAPVFPGDVEFELRWGWTLSADCPVNVSTLTLSPHTGAHADAPLHYDPAGAAVGALDLAPFLGPCRVVHAVNCGPLVEWAHLEHALDGAALAAGQIERLLVRTCARAATAWDPALTGFAPATVERLADLGMRLIGIDTASIDPADSKTLPSHQVIRRRELRVLENLVLDDVPEGDYELIALPLKLSTADASPVRAVLREL